MQLSQIVDGSELSISFTAIECPCTSQIIQQFYKMFLLTIQGITFTILPSTVTAQICE